MPGSPLQFEAFFLPAARGQRFCVLHRPPAGSPAKGCVVYVHPFAEEMNRARRMAALQASAFAEAGFAVLLIDQFGCGDSSGDFEQASWDVWLEDVGLAAQWLSDRYPGPLWLWGLRSGCLLAAQAASSIAGRPANLLLWQPVLSGRQHLRQFLRLRMAAEVARGGRGESTEALAARLAAGDAVEVAGYMLSSALARGLEQASFDGLQPPAGADCIELQAAADLPLSPGLDALLQRWRQQGHEGVVGQVVAGEAFWQSIEVEVSPALLAASSQAVAKGTP